MPREPAYVSLAAALRAGFARAGGGGFVSIGPDGQQIRLAWQESADRALRLVAGLQALGFGPGDALLLQSGAAADLVTAVHAGILGGYCIIPCTTRPASALQPLCAAQFRRLCVIDAPELARLLTSPAPAAELPEDQGGAALRFAIPTSGTTGTARLVGLSDAAALARWWPVLPGPGGATGFLSWTAFDHVMGMGMAMPDLPLKLHLDTRRFISQPLTWLDALQQSGASHATMTSFGLSLLVKALAGSPERVWDLRQVQRIGIGAESVSRPMVEAALRALMPFGLREDAMIAGYGMTECGPVAGGGTPFLPGAGGDDSPPELDRPTAGHALRITGAAGEVLAEGVTGAIEVRGPTMTSGYIGDPEANAALFTADGWLRTGDLGLLRDGRLTVTGRAKELIIVDAKKYTCQEIEARLRAATGLSEIYAVPLNPAQHQEQGGGLGAACALFVVCAKDEAPPDLARQLAAAMAAEFRFTPGRISQIAPGDLPRTGLGKLRRLALAESDSPNLMLALRAGRAAADGADTDQLSRIWREVLELEPGFDPEADFFLLGGTSLKALQLSAAVERIWGCQLNLQDFPDRFSLSDLGARIRGSDRAGEGGDEGLAARLRQLMADWPGRAALPDGLIRQLSPGDLPGRPERLFWCTQDATGAGTLRKYLARRLNSYVLRSGVYLFHYDSPQARAAARLYADEILRLAPDGPLILGGDCQGAMLIREILPLLRAAGRAVDLFIVADAHFQRLARDQAFDVPLVLLALAGSRFNPRRWFRDPEAGLRKYAPRGFMLRILPGTYAQTLAADHGARTADAILDAIGQARALQPAVDLPAPAPPASSFYQRRLRSRIRRLSLVAGQEYILPVSVRNRSELPWPAHAQSGLALGNHWLSPEGEILIWSDGHCPLPRLLAPHQSMGLRLMIRAPERPGPALLELDLAEEGLRWFAEVSGKALQIPVTILPRPQKAALPWYRRLLWRRRAVPGS